jgi:hypothetical protein
MLPAQNNNKISILFVAVTLGEQKTSQRERKQYCNHESTARFFWMVRQSHRQLRGRMEYVFLPSTPPFLTCTRKDAKR